MNRMFVTSVLVILMNCFMATADYYNPHIWKGQTAYTHQSWDFGDSGEYGMPTMVTDMSALPLGSLPDGDPNWVNEYGTPSLYTFFNSHPFMKGWMYVPEIASTDRVAMYGGMGDTWVKFMVPGASGGDDWIRQIWVQMIVYARKDGEQQVASVQIARDSLFTDTDGIVMVSELVEPLNEPEGYSAAWYRVTFVYEVAQTGDAEHIKATAYYDPALPDPQRLGASMIDRVDIDTRFVLKADIDRSGTVDYADFAILASQWLSVAAESDFDGSGFVGVEDILYFAAMWLDNN